MQPHGSAMQMLLVVFVYKQVGTYVLERDVILRVVRPFPNVLCVAGVEDRLAAEHPADSAGGWLDVVHGSDC
jgi:hypothetical protein